MQVDKETVTRSLRSRGDHDRAQQAECALSRQVDTERDAGLLQQLDVDVTAIEEEAAAEPEPPQAPGTGAAPWWCGRSR